MDRGTGSGRRKKPTFERATDPTMEQGLEVQAHRDEECGKPRPKSDEEKGERARFAVNVTAGDGPSGDASPRR
jgi:hypothetical protein